ncbi:MAG: hypothetical protein WC759_00460 [Candidatus Micrarchaeia archaeon]
MARTLAERVACFERSLQWAGEKRPGDASRLLRAYQLLFVMGIESTGGLDERLSKEPESVCIRNRKPAGKAEEAVINSLLYNPLYPMAEREVPGITAELQEYVRNSKLVGCLVDILASEDAHSVFLGGFDYGRQHGRPQLADLETDERKPWLKETVAAVSPALSHRSTMPYDPLLPDQIMHYRNYCVGMLRRALSELNIGINDESGLAPYVFAINALAMLKPYKRDVLRDMARPGLEAASTGMRIRLGEKADLRAYLKGKLSAEPILLTGVMEAGLRQVEAYEVDVLGAEKGELYPFRHAAGAFLFPQRHIGMPVPNDALKTLPIGIRKKWIAALRARDVEALNRANAELALLFHDWPKRQQILGLGENFEQAVGLLKGYELLALRALGYVTDENIDARVQFKGYEKGGEAYAAFMKAAGELKKIAEEAGAARLAEIAARLVELDNPVRRRKIPPATRYIYREQLDFVIGAMKPLVGMTFRDEKGASFKLLEMDQQEYEKDGLYASYVCINRSVAGGTGRKESTRTYWTDLYKAYRKIISGEWVLPPGQLEELKAKVAASKLS